MCLTMAKPSPVPPRCGCAPCRRDRSARRGAAGARDRCPSRGLVTSIVASPSSTARRTCTVLPSGLYLMALSTRFTTACSSSGGLMIGVDGFGRLQLDRDALRLGLGVADLHRHPHHVAQAALLQLDAAAVGSLLHAREAEQVFDDGVQPVGLADDDAQEALRLGRLVLGSVQQGLGESLDRRHRRLDLVRDVGDELAPHALQGLQAADVVEHGNGADALPAVPLQHCAAHLDVAVAPVRAQRQLPLDLLVLGERAGDQLSAARCCAPPPGCCGRALDPRRRPAWPRPPGSR